MELTTEIEIKKCKLCGHEIKDRYCINCGFDDEYELDEIEYKIRIKYDDEDKVPEISFSDVAPYVISGLFFLVVIICYVVAFITMGW
nr:MAG: hypothetical protein [Lokiarchaeota virus Ratatoskr Meg22_1012]